MDINCEEAINEEMNSWWQARERKGGRNNIGITVIHRNPRVPKNNRRLEIWGTESLVAREGKRIKGEYLRDFEKTSPSKWQVWELKEGDLKIWKLTTSFGRS